MSMLEVRYPVRRYSASNSSRNPNGNPTVAIGPIAYRLDSDWAKELSRSLVSCAPPFTPKVKLWAGSVPAHTSSKRIECLIHSQRPFAWPIALQGWGKTRGAYSFLKSLSKAFRASSALRGAGGPAFTAGEGGGAEAP